MWARADLRGSISPRADAQQELTTDQRGADLVQLASLYAKNYAPYEWKRDVIGFDLYRLTPWLQRVHPSDDLDFQEALIDYVASLNEHMRGSLSLRTSALPSASRSTFTTARSSSIQSTGQSCPWGSIPSASETSWLPWTRSPSTL